MKNIVFKPEYTLIKEYKHDEFMSTLNIKLQKAISIAHDEYRIQKDKCKCLIKVSIQYRDYKDIRCENCGEYYD